MREQERDPLGDGCRLVREIREHIVAGDRESARCAAAKIRKLYGCHLHVGITDDWRLAMRSHQF